MRLVMNQPPPWITDPRNRKWVLTFWLALLACSVWLWMIWPHPSKLEPITVTAGAAMGLFNHVVSRFLSPESQRRMALPQMIFIGLYGGLVVTFWIATVWT